MKKVTTSDARLVELMQAFDINQTDICNRTGLHKSSMSCYVSGKRPLGKTTLIKISRAFNVSVDWLMGYDVPMNVSIEVMKHEEELQDEQALRVARMFSALTERDKGIVYKLLAGMNEDREEK